MVMLNVSVITIEDEYRSAMNGIVRAHIETGKYPFEKDNCRDVLDAIELLLKMDPVYITAACNFMGYPISYIEVSNTVNEMLRSLGVDANTVWN